jgi:hypothetical protein
MHQFIRPKDFSYMEHSGYRPDAAPVVERYLVETGCVRHHAAVPADALHSTDAVSLHHRHYDVVGALQLDDRVVDLYHEDLLHKPEMQVAPTRLGYRAIVAGLPAIHETADRVDCLIDIEPSRSMGDDGDGIGSLNATLLVELHKGDERYDGKFTISYDLKTGELATFHMTVFNNGTPQGATPHYCKIDYVNYGDPFWRVQTTRADIAPATAGVPTTMHIERAVFLRGGSISLSDDRLWRPEVEGLDGRIINGRDKVGDRRTYMQESVGTQTTFRHTPKSTSSFGKPYFTDETSMWFDAKPTGNFGIEDSSTSWSAPYDLGARLGAIPIDFEYAGAQDQAAYLLTEAYERLINFVYGDQTVLTGSEFLVK